MSDLKRPTIDVVDEPQSYGGCTRCRRRRYKDGFTQYERLYSLTWPGQDVTTVYVLCQLCFDELWSEMRTAATKATNMDRAQEQMYER